MNSRPCSSRLPSFLQSLFVLIWITTGTDVSWATAPEQEHYWWQDEMRQVAAALSMAESGSVARWPRMTVAAGAATLPLPLADSTVTCDGRLDEQAWLHATSFPVGPIFDRWADGPFELRVSVCRDRNRVYVAVDSPRSLAGLGAMTADAELFRLNGRPFRLGLPEVTTANVGMTDAGHHIVEWSAPITSQVKLTFPVEMIRRREGKLPSGLRHLGLDRVVSGGASRDYRKPSLWLEPITISLLPDGMAVQIQSELRRNESSEGGSGRQSSVDLRMRVTVGGEQEEATHQPMEVIASGGVVVPFHWQRKGTEKTYFLKGFCYRADAAAAVRSVRRTAQRLTPGSSASDLGASWQREVDRLEQLAGEISPLDVRSRSLYCQARRLRSDVHRTLLDAPLLLVKRHPYFAGHIYDDYYTWHPGGGIYVVENPSAPIDDHRVRPIIDGETNETLGNGVYRDPDLSWDGRRLVFAYRPNDQSVTSIYGINVDGSKLHRLTKSDEYSDITPAFLPDGRITFTSTRPRALVPCFNSGVDTLHTMNADGSSIHSVSVNNVNEFDPSVLADGRILYGRWEYVDKTALYMQSLWTMLPDGTMEEAWFGNNLARPTAILDARPVPGSSQVVASLTPHNGQAVGAIGMIDATKGKNSLRAISNFTPEYPVEMDQGLRSGPSDPWAISSDDVLISNNAIGAHAIIELVDRFGCRDLIACDPQISCYAPMLVRSRPTPPEVARRVTSDETGEFFLVDVYRGLTGVERGSIKRLRVLEETARTSGIPNGGRWWNQAFLVSWQGAYTVKNVLGTVPVHPDGSARFRVPAGRAVYFEALDAQGREVQRMRTFVQAAPGTTRSCVGCHEDKRTAPQLDHTPQALLVPAAELEAESWGSGYIDYASMIQPVLDRHCVSCHGGAEGIAAGIDLSGGWTWAFNISYETLIKHRLTGFLNCHNSSTHTSERLPPYTIGSGAAPLADTLMNRCKYLPGADRDLLFAWMDTNSNYYGTWDYSPHATCDAILKLRQPLTRMMSEAGCMNCHQDGFIGNDWVNLQKPEWSRILRAPLAAGEGLGVAFCRNRKARNGYPLVTQATQPPDVVKPGMQPEWDPSGEVRVSFRSTNDPHYQQILSAILGARAEALATPRIDMPGAEILPGLCRLQQPVNVPDHPAMLKATIDTEERVVLNWQLDAVTIGLEYEVYRGDRSRFSPEPGTYIGLTTAGRFVDCDAPAGEQHYALVAAFGDQRSQPVWATIVVPVPKAPEAPGKLTTESFPGRVRLSWSPPTGSVSRYDVYRTNDSGNTVCLTREPITSTVYNDARVEPGRRYDYQVRAVSRQGLESEPSPNALAEPRPFEHDPVFEMDLTNGPTGRCLDGTKVVAKLAGKARVVKNTIELGEAGWASFEHVPFFDISTPFSFECWVRIDRESQMPVLMCAGNYQHNGWFLQRFGSGWRWHLAPVSCDGGHPVVGEWTHLAGAYDGEMARLFQDGEQVAAVRCPTAPSPARSPLMLGQYSRRQSVYQVQGALGGVRLYQRILGAEEIAARFQKGPPE